jgi:hypothetical protein
MLLKTRFILLASVIMLAGTVYSQQANTPEALRKKLQKNFSAIPTSKYPDLIPYAEGTKWGYIDKVSKKILIHPIFDYPEFFKPDLDIFQDMLHINITHTGEVTVSQDYGQDMLDGGRYPDQKVRSSKDGFKGFTVDKNGILLTYSDLYENKNLRPEENVKVFKFSDQYFAIVCDKDKRCGIIDLNGNPMKGFEFNFSEIEINPRAKDHTTIWFIVRKPGNYYYGFVNTNGIEKCSNELISRPSPMQVFGLSICNSRDTSGIIDLYNLEWAVRPQTAVQIDRLKYSTAAKLNIYEPSERSEANIYYKVVVGNKEYFMDLAGNIYLPK